MESYADRKNVLLYGNGNTLKKNIHWINQIYHVVGITDTKETRSKKEQGRFSVKDAVKLDYDEILVTSFYFEEIKNHLMDSYGIKSEIIKNCLDEFHSERHMKFGELNPNVVFYILRAHWEEHKNGLFNFYARAIIEYHHTQEMGYELLIDMKNYYTEYAGLEKYGKINVWEDYFCQPSGYSLDEAYRSQNVILSKFNDDLYSYADLSGHTHCSNKWYVETYLKLGRMYHNRFSFSAKIQNRLKREEEVLFKDKGRVLGVLARGTDMIYLKPDNHFIPYGTEGFVAHIKQKMKEMGFRYLYLATEDLDILEQFQSVFKGELLFSKQQRLRNTGDKMLMDIKFDREDDGYLRGLEYSTVIYMLSRCDSLIANCNCGGVLGALILSGDQYRQMEVLDAGVYKQGIRE